MTTRHEHSPRMLAMLDLSAQPTMYESRAARAEGIDTYKLACEMVAERVLGGGLAGQIAYWVAVRDQLIAKYKFTEAEINDGDS